MVTTSGRLGKDDGNFQYSLCRVVLMVAEREANPEEYARPFSTRSVESF